MKHPSHFDLTDKFSVQGTDSGNKDLSGLNIPSSLVSIISADNDNASWPASDPLSMPSPDENITQNHTMSAGSQDELYENSKDGTRDNDDVSDISSIDSDEYLDIDVRDLLEVLIYQDEILEDHHGGHVY